MAAVQGAGASRLGRGIVDGDMPNLGGSMSDDLVAISMNENPLGPAQSALEAICKTASVSNRYHGEMIQATVSTAIDLFGMKHGYVALFPGSAGALNLALMSNIGPDRPLVYADPSYEQGPSVANESALQSSRSSSQRNMRTMCAPWLRRLRRPGVLHCESEQSDGNDDSQGRYCLAAEEQACRLGGHRRRSVSPFLECRVVHRSGCSGPGHHRDADVLEDLRHGRHAGGAGVCAA